MNIVLQVILEQLHLHVPVPYLACTTVLHYYMVLMHAPLYYIITLLRN